MGEPPEGWINDGRDLGQVLSSLSCVFMIHAHNTNRYTKLHTHYAHACTLTHIEHTHTNIHTTHTDTHMDIIQVFFSVVEIHENAVLTVVTQNI